LVHGEERFLVDEKARAQLAALYKLLQRPDVDRVVNGDPTLDRGLSEQGIEEAERLADTVMIMSHGKAVAAGPPAEIPAGAVIPIRYPARAAASAGVMVALAAVLPALGHAQPAAGVAGPVLFEPQV